jgi:hypothetical protein
MPSHHPGIAFGLWSHKILRWLSPFFLIGLGVCANLSALWGSGEAVLAIAAAIDALGFAAAMGFVAERLRLRIPLAGAAYSFVLANAGFLVGVCRALGGRSIEIYRK